MLVHKLMTLALAAPQGVSAANHRGRSHRELARRQQTGDGHLPTLTDPDLCLGVLDNAVHNRQPVVLQSCDNKATAKWRFDGNALKTDRNMCLDVPDGNDIDGQTLQIYRCYPENTNQAWARVGPQTLQWLGHNKCVDVMDGCFSEETPIQLWQCFTGNTNQAYNFSAVELPGNAISTTSTATYSSPQSTATSAAALPSFVASPSASSPNTDTFYGYKIISLSAFVARYPDCAQWQAALQAAGDSTGINPTFLGSIAMIESGCGAGLMGSDNAQYGPFQFMDDNAWNKYGGTDKDRTNFWDAAYGAARYFKTLINNEQGNLYQAMRDYNGPPSQGGLPAYQNIVAGYMSGTY